MTVRDRLVRMSEPVTNEILWRAVLAESQSRKRE